MAERHGTAGDRARGLRILIASADPRVRAWAEDGFPADVTLCAVADDTSTLAELVKATRADVCLLDLRLPGGALAAMSALEGAAPRTRIVAWAAREDEPSLVDAVNAGAAGCISGWPDRAGIARALADIMAGQPALPRTVVTRLVAQLRLT